MASAKYTALSTVEQPRAGHGPSMVMDPTRILEEKGKQCGSVTTTPGHAHACQNCDSDAGGDMQHRRCHNGRLRHFLVPFLVLLVLCGGVAAMSCMSMSGSMAEGWGALVSRAVADNGSGTGTQDPFVHRKLYLIVVFVGLFVVVILAIMLSAWCCRGAFENPCCCPCYLCACCGGLACLECIGCGLCAEGASQM